jgi:hypothetical protein
MFSLLLLAFVRAQLLKDVENDIPAFVAGQMPSLKPAETASLDFGVHVALLPKFPPIETGTQGKIQIAEDGFGIAMMIGPQVLDIALSQIPEDGLPDKVDTIGFVAAVHTSKETGPTFSFALDFKGVEPLQLCFEDTVMNIANEKFLRMVTGDGRRLQEVVPAADIPGAPTITMSGSTEIISFPVGGEFISDGTTAYEVGTLALALTPPDNTGATRAYATAQVLMTGPDPAFKFMAEAIAGNTKGPIFGGPTPIVALDLPVPEFCVSGSATQLNVAKITEGMVKEAAGEVGEMDLEDVGDSTARKLTGLDAKKNLAVHVLKKMHATTELFNAYKLEKKRLVRMTFIQYSVATVLALALLFSAGAVARHSLRARKSGMWDALAANDEEALREGVETQ